MGEGILIVPADRDIVKYVRVKRDPTTVHRDGATILKTLKTTQGTPVAGVNDMTLRDYRRNGND